MVSVNNVLYFVLVGNTYPNKDAIRAAGATWDNGRREWKLAIKGHPLNNAKQKKQLTAQLDQLEAAGVRFVAYYSQDKPQ